MLTRTTAQVSLDDLVVLWYVHGMTPDYYDEDLPESSMSLVESLKANKETATTVSKIVGIPVVAFLATCVFNYYINKKVKTLC